MAPIGRDATRESAAAVTLHLVLELFVLAMGEHQLTAELSHHVEGHRRVLRQQLEEHVGADAQHYETSLRADSGRAWGCRQHAEFTQQLIRLQCPDHHLATVSTGLGEDVRLTVENHVRAVGDLALGEDGLAVLVGLQLTGERKQLELGLLEL